MPAVGGSRGDVGRGGGLRLAGARWRGFGAAGYRGSGVRCGVGCHGSAYGRGDGNTRAAGGAGTSDSDARGDSSGGRDARTARSGTYADPGRDGGAQSVAHADGGQYANARSVAHAEPVADSRDFRAADADAGWDCGADAGDAGRAASGDRSRGRPAGVSRVSGG